MGDLRWQNVWGAGSEARGLSGKLLLGCGSAELSVRVIGAPVQLT